MPLKILNKNEMNEILNKLNEQFGIQKFPDNSILAKRGEEKIFLFTGDLSKEDISKIEKSSNIEGIGVYFCKVEEKSDLVRLSIEGAQLLQNQISKNIIELENEKQVEEWMMGRELPIKTENHEKHGFVIIKYKEDFIGCGKASENKISNFIPKSRRLKEKG